MVVNYESKWVCKEVVANYSEIFSLNFYGVIASVPTDIRTGSLTNAPNTNQKHLLLGRNYLVRYLLEWCGNITEL
jgi:hypothetical protein